LVYIVGENERERERERERKRERERETEREKKKPNGYTREVYRDKSFLSEPTYLHQRTYKMLLKIMFLIIFFS